MYLFKIYALNLEILLKTNNFAHLGTLLGEHVGTSILHLLFMDNSIGTIFSQLNKCVYFSHGMLVGSIDITGGR